MIAGGLALAADGAEAFAAEARPFRPVRSDEDYGYLRDADERTGLDRLRYIALGRDAYLSLGGEARIRVDAFDAPRFGVAGEEADTYALTRLLFSADAHLGSRVRVYGELGAHRDTGKTAPPGGSDRDRLDAQLLFADVTPVDGWRVRLGRQEVAISPSQRFVALREAANIRQAFDGLRVTRNRNGLRLDAFYLQPVVNEPGSFDDHRNHGQRFYGAYGAGRLDKATSLDVYVMGLERDDVRFGRTRGDERRLSAGLRLAGTQGAFDYEIEAVVQRGRFAGQAIRAWAVGAGAGYTLEQPWKPRLGLRLDNGSGDKDPADGRLGTFNPYFPRGGYFNETGLTGWSNLSAARPSLTLTPHRTLTLEASYLVRRRATAADAIYLQPMAVLPGSDASRARAVGQAIQLDAAWQASRNVRVQVQAVRQKAGAAAIAAGGRDTDFGMAIVQYRF
ncbi:MAG: alginate export family protein [Caulobacter sp.]|nr:alginate export family protein [Caulobacter sp.]